MNILGQIKQFEELIRQGYGYSQLLEKMNLTEQNLKEMESINEETKKKLDFFREKIIGKPKFKHLIGGK